MQITLRDIARKSGFSVTTVSRALAGYQDVNEQTRQHIIEVANILGYQPNLLARGLRSQRTQTLGLIIPTYDAGFPNEFFNQFLLGVGDTAWRNHYDLLVSAQVPGEEEMAAYRRMVKGLRVDGMILARTRKNDPRMPYLQSQGHPFVVNGRNAPDEPSDFPYVDVDSRMGIRAATAHFIALGHEHIGLVLPPPEIAYTGYRLQGYQDALREARLPLRDEYILYGDLQRSGGYQAGLALLSRYPQISAIVACNDLMAFGVMAAIQERGLEVGSDVAVSGFDDLPAAEYAMPPLTTVRQPIYEIGQRLVEMLIGIIVGKPPEETQIVLPSRLIVRASSGFNGRR
ncbi:MAG: LacI family DNA-binding transcriptional regulator [Chloroflexi bacterium]|nr:LacI family DNA-binding transcriptional regulator [Chloroflexota bacterium]